MLEIVIADLIHCRRISDNVVEMPRSSGDHPFKVVGEWLEVSREENNWRKNTEH